MVVDLASEMGGNCEYTVPNTVQEVAGKQILGYTDLPSRLPQQSSMLFSNNISNLFMLITAGTKGRYAVDLSDPVVRGCLVLEGGELRCDGV